LGFAPHPKIQLLLSQERAITSNLSRTITGFIRTKAMKNLKKRECGRSRGLPNFLSIPPIISGTEKATDFKFGQYIFRGSIRTKAHKKFGRKGSVGVSRDCSNFLGTPYYLRTGKATDFKFGLYTCRRYIRTKAH